MRRGRRLSNQKHSAAAGIRSGQHLLGQRCASGSSTYLQFQFRPRFRIPAALPCVWRGLAVGTFRPQCSEKYNDRKMNMVHNSYLLSILLVECFSFCLSFCLFVDVNVQVSLSLFHLKSSSFFGSTWMGPPVSLGSSFSKTLELDYPDIIYLTTRIVDQTCIGVIEVVVSQVDAARNITKAQFGYVHALPNTNVVPTIHHNNLS